MEELNGELKKKKKCKKATRLLRFDCSGQRWKLDNNRKLENKEGVWKSVDEWKIRSRRPDKITVWIYIENTSKTKVLGATIDGKVIFEDLEENKFFQLWRKGELDAEDYFTLENAAVPKVLTAISDSSLEIKGNIIMR